MQRSKTSRPTVALALGGGGARGLAHIAVLEALDELGVRPVAIAGSSMGAAIGAAYAAGLNGRDIRRHVISIVHDRGETLRRLFSARAGGLAELFAGRFASPMLLDAAKLCALFLPPAVPATFEALPVPLFVTATDLYAREATLFRAGPLHSAIAASIAIPGLVEPVVIDERIFVDGSATNPLPFEPLCGLADVVLAVDASLGPAAPRGLPDPWDALFATIQVMGHTIVAEKLLRAPPVTVVTPNVAGFRLLDFFKTSAILRAAEPIKAEVKRALVEARAS